MRSEPDLPLFYDTLNPFGSSTDAPDAKSNCSLISPAFPSLLSPLSHFHFFSFPFLSFLSFQAFLVLRFIAVPLLRQRKEQVAFQGHIYLQFHIHLV